jgi:catechol 2,3-dioxygenase-like lactoylglutathione lyase family enzyme
MVARITHVVINASDVKRSMKFYSKIFSLLGIKKIPNYPAYWNGSFSFWLHKRKKGKYAMEKVGYHHIAISASSRKQVDDMQKLLDKYSFKTLYRAEEHPEYQPGYYSVSFKDPDGIVLELLYLPRKKGYG